MTANHWLDVWMGGWIDGWIDYTSEINSIA